MKSTKEGNHQGIQTCHLCGKVQCGQRLGRVKCAFCSRIFCLQQLQRKFGIIAIANDPNFKCPRCTGVCCCMCNCQKPPPHVHCKVYKVRQNKVDLFNSNLIHRKTLLSERQIQMNQKVVTLQYRMSIIVRIKTFRHLFLSPMSILLWLPNPK